MTLPYAKATEPTQFHFVSLREGIADAAEQCIDDRLGLFLGQFYPLRYPFHEIGFGHRRSSSTTHIHGDGD
jgi:hypothetical protein